MRWCIRSSRVNSSAMIAWAGREDSSASRRLGEPPSTGMMRVSRMVCSASFSAVRSRSSRCAKGRIRAIRPLGARRYLEQRSKF